MKIKHPFNTLTVPEYIFYIDHHKKYTNFNVLGLYRSLTEHTRLTTEDKIAVREYAHRTFRKSFDFLQLKDPWTFLQVSTLGEELTQADEHQRWTTIRENQQRILADKKLKHRNFGRYAKHSCGYDTCPFNGIMVKQGTWLVEMNMHFHTDKNRFIAQTRSEQRRSDRKKAQKIVQEHYAGE